MIINEMPSEEPSKKYLSGCNFKTALLSLKTRINVSSATPFSTIFNLSCLSALVFNTVTIVFNKRIRKSIGMPNSNTFVWYQLKFIRVISKCSMYYSIHGHCKLQRPLIKQLPVRTVFFLSCYFVCDESDKAGIIKVAINRTYILFLELPLYWSLPVKL